MSKIIFRAWHRRLGLASIAMVLWLSISGIVINHGDRLALNKTIINTAITNKLYGLENTQSFPKGFYLEQNFFFCHEKKFYRNSNVIGACDEGIKSLQVVNDQLVMLSRTGLVLLTDEYDFIEFLEFSSLFEGSSFDINLDQSITDSLWKAQLFSSEMEVLVLAFESSTSSTAEYFSLDLLSLELATINPTVLNLAKAEAISLIELPKKFSHYLDFPGVTLEQLLLDAHSGRLFGRWGVVFVDFFALAFIALSLSGFWIFIKRR